MEGRKDLPEKIPIKSEAGKEEEKKEKKEYKKKRINYYVT